MFRKNCVVTPSTAPHRNTRPTCEAMKGQRMNSPDESPTPAATTPGPTIRQRSDGGSGRSRTTVSFSDRVANGWTEKSVIGGEGNCIRQGFRKGSERVQKGSERVQGSTCSSGSDADLNLEPS